MAGLRPGLKKRTISWIIIMTLLWGILGAVAHISYATLDKNQVGVFEYLKEQVEVIKEQEVRALEEVFKAGGSIQEAITFVSNNEINSSTRWQVLCYKDHVFFAKDEDYTRRYLSEATTIEAFQKTLSEEGRWLTLSKLEIDDGNYSYGIVLDEEKLYTELQFKQERDSIIIAIVVLGICSFMLVLWLFIENYYRTKKEKVLSGILEGERLKLEKAMQEVISSKTMPPSTAKEDVKYDRQFLEVILKKTNQEELMPLSMYYMKWELSSRYYSKQELQDLIDLVRAHLSNNHLVFEVGKGEIVVLMYYTTNHQCLSICKSIEETLSRHLLLMGILLRKESVTVENGEDCYKAFTQLETKVKEGVSYEAAM